MFNDLLKQSASIMEAYKKMKEAEEQKKQETCTEGDDTGGDGSAYNKYLLGKTGDLPRTKKAYMKVDEEGKKDPCWDGYEMVGMKKKDGKEVPNCVPEKIEEEMSEVDHDAAFDKWRSDVRAAHPQRKLKFYGRVEKGTSTISAEDPSEHKDTRKSYGIWEPDTNKGHIFTK